LISREVEINFSARVSECHAAYCRPPFALSRKHIQKHAIDLDLVRPYMILCGDDGYCHHLDRGNQCCTVGHRPAPRRAYDCRRNPRIWLDFDKSVVNRINHSDWQVAKGRL
jgi:hypothetical protein